MILIAIKSGYTGIPGVTCLSMICLQMDDWEYDFKCQQLPTDHLKGKIKRADITGAKLLFFWHRHYDPYCWWLISNNWHWYNSHGYYLNI